jgi:transposase
LVTTGLGQIDAADAGVEPIDRWLAVYARRQPGCRALIRELFGVGAVTAPTILAELGDARRFRNGDAVVRWALFEAAKSSARSSAPDHAYYHDARDRLTPNRATLSVARKLVRRARHLLAALGDDALGLVDPALLPPLQPAGLPQAA